MAHTWRSDLVLFRRLLTYARSCWGGIIGLFLLSLVSTPLALLTPVPLKIAVDNAIGGQPLPPWINAVLPAVVQRSSTTLLGAAAILLVLTALLTQWQARTSAILSTVIGQRLTLQFRTALFRHVQRLSLGYHDTRGSMYSTYGIAYDAPAIQYVAIDGIIPFITSGISLLAIVYVTLHLDWQLAIVALAVSPVLLVLSNSYRRQMRSMYREAKRHENLAIAVVQEVLGALRVVKAFAQEDREEERFLERAREGARAQHEVSMAEGTFGLLIGMTTAIGTAATLWIGVVHVQAGALTLGGLLLVMSYLSQLYGPLTTISRKVAGLQAHFASLDRVFGLLDEAPDVPERPHPRPLSRATGALSFRHVSFGYAPDRSILHDVSFDLSAGMCLGISGTTGAGKTTLVNLLDGVDLRDYRLADLRGQFAIVLQEPVLFSTTLRENIAYGKPGAAEAEIIAAAKAANVHDFIVGLPQGYDTLVGERGMRLSGGERQRISLARAFLKDAPILILDEPTSSVDTATEANIMEAMARLMRGRTTLMIAHRLSTLDYCDARMSLEDGRVTSPLNMTGQHLERVATHARWLAMDAPTGDV